VNARQKRTRPFHHRRVEMWVRDGNGIDAAEGFNHRHRRVVERGDAIPKDVAVVSAHEQRALADSERGRRADANNALLVFAEGVGVGLLQRLKCGPSLPARRDVLALLLADAAMSRYLSALGILRAARGADEEGHRLIPWIPGRR